MLKLRVPYGRDPEAHKIGAFYWPGSPAKRREIYSVKRASPNEFESVYQGRPGSRQGSIFLDDDFDYYNPPPGLESGIEGEGVRQFLLKGSGVFQAWDTAFTETKNSAWTVCETQMYVPCNKYHRGEDPAVFGPCEHHFDVVVLDVFREKMDWGGLTLAFKAQTLKWHPELSIVEKRASGITLFQAVESAGFPILGVEATESKRARAINGVGAGSVQGWHRQHRVLYPADAKWFPEYKRELKDFTGADGEQSDQVDSHVHGVTYAIKEGSHSALLPTGWTPERGTPLGDAASLTPGFDNLNYADPRAMLLMNLGNLDTFAVDPFDGLCDRCSNYSRGFCSLWNQKKVAMDSCPAFSPRFAS